MIEIELLRLDLVPHEEVLEATLERADAELQFNGRLVWGDIVKAIVAGRRDIAAGLDIQERYVTPIVLDIALYNPEEKALYVAVEYQVPGQDSSGNPITFREERMITCGRAPRTVKISKVSVGTTAKMLELMDVIDLSRVIWLPL